MPKEDDSAVNSSENQRKINILACFLRICIFVFYLGSGKKVFLSTFLFSFCFLFLIPFPWYTDSKAFTFVKKNAS